jgi:hypothetical protein
VCQNPTSQRLSLKASTQSISELVGSFGDIVGPVTPVTAYKDSARTRLQLLPSVVLVLCVAWFRNTKNVHCFRLRKPSTRTHARLALRIGAVIRFHYHCRIVLPYCICIFSITSYFFLCFFIVALDYLKPHFLFARTITIPPFEARNTSFPHISPYPKRRL